ncbi:MAG: MASE1 domain-containing protein, partial [Anaerolineaceae bacterium]
MMDKQQAVSEYLGKSLIFVISYFIGIQLGLYITLHLSVSSVVWVPIGISIALVYLWGYRYLPVFTTLSLIAAIFYGLPVLPSLPPIIASTLTCYLAVLLLKQKLKINPALTSLRDVMVLLLVGLLMPLIPSTISTASFLSAGLIDTSGLLNLWLEWWAIDLLGILLIVPLVLVWHSNLKGKSNYIIKRWDWLILILVVFLTWWIFRQEIGTPIYFGSLTYLIYPFLFWIALRLYQPGITLANLFICLMALFTVIEGSTFGTKTLIQSMIMLDVFMLALTITSLTLASLFTERKEINLRLQEFNLNLEDRINQRTREFKSLNSQLK